MRIILVAFLFGALISCAKKTDITEDANFQGDHTSYEIQCQAEPNPTPTPYVPMVFPELPPALPRVETEVAVDRCDGLEEGPTFPNKQMPGLAAVVNCKDHVVRFRSRDWQVNEAAGIGPLGDFDLHFMYIVRMKKDIAGNAACWTRLLGHVQGNVNCPSNPNGARITFKTKWIFDETPPEIMEPPSPGLADLRNGKHCTVNPGNCQFSNDLSAGCGG